LRPAKAFTFGVVFKSSDAYALEKLKAFLTSQVKDSKIVYSYGPTEKFLWILSGVNPVEGKVDAHAK